MRTLLSSTFLSPLAIALLPTAAAAQVVISTATTTPVSTSTANAGSPSAINVTADGSITLSGGTAITVDSNHAVSNAGKLVMGAANGANGIVITSGRNAAFTNTGTITLLENFTAPNPDGNSIVDGPIAQATDRAGVRVLGGGTHVGDIIQTGSITVEGLNSAAMRIGDTLNGSLRVGGTSSVRGDNSVGIAMGSVTGDVVIGGRVAVVGRGATALNIAGDVGGMVRLENSIGQQVSYIEDNNVTMSLARADLRVGAPAVAIAGNVGGGIYVAPAPTISTTNPDTDGDGIPDSQEAAGAIQSYGNGAALRIGGATDTVIGTLSGNTHGLVVAGSVLANAPYSNTDALAVQIGGLGGNVTVTGGLSNTGRIQATTNDSTATAVLINAGSSVPVIDNSGTIVATITSPGEGASYGIRDLSGTLATINNSGFITATGTAQDTTYVLDLELNTSGVTVNQTAPTGTADDADTTGLAIITGNIRTGSGNDLLKIAGGSVLGNSFLGAGNDTIALSRDSVYAGIADFGMGTGTLTLANSSKFFGTAAFNDQSATITIGDTAHFTGKITGGSNLTVSVNGGTLEASTEDVAFNTLNVGANGTIKVDIDTINQTNPKFVVGTANFASGAHVSATINSLTNAEGTYTILTANQISGTPSFTDDETILPYLFKGAVTVDTTQNALLLNIQHKSAQELALNRNQAAIYPAILAAAPADDQIQESLIGITDHDGLSAQFDQFMPDHAGGNLDLLVGGSRMASRHITNNNALFDLSATGGWFEAVKWVGDKNPTATAPYHTRGWGLSGGLERVTGIGHVGLSLAWLTGKNENPAGFNSIEANAYEFGAFWRMSRGPFYAYARAGLSLASFDSNRFYIGTDATETQFGRGATASWNAKLYSAQGGLSYQFDFGDRISIKPMAIIDYYRLDEDGYTETGGNLSDTIDAFDLIVAPRTSETSSATTTLTGIYRFGRRTREGIPLTLELEGGRRTSLSGKPGDTTAHFVGGQDFTLTADKLPGAWLGEARLLSGGLDYTWTIAAGAEQTQGDPAWTARVSLGVAF